MGTTINNTPLTDVQRKLAGDYVNLAHRVSNRWAADHPRFACELDDEAADALIVAARNYDPARGVRFATYYLNIAHLRCCKRLQSLLRHDDQFGAPIDPDEFASKAPDPSESIADRDHCESVLSRLDPLQRRLVELTARDGYTTREAAKIVGISRSWVTYTLGLVRMTHGGESALGNARRVG